MFYVADMIMDYKTIGHALQVEGFKTNVDTEFVTAQDVPIPDNPTRLDGIKLFNEIAMKNDLKPLSDPLGYMTLDDNLYSYIHNKYQTEYSNTIDMVENGLMGGGPYALRAVAGKLPQNIRKDMTPFMPENFKYSEMRYVKASDEMKHNVDKYVSARVQLTHLHSMRRRVEDATFEDIHHQMSSAGNKLKDLIEESLNGPIVKKSLSKAKLLENSGNNKIGLDAFIEKLSNPDTIDKPDDSRPIASFKTSDMATARFLLSNKSYLSEFGFNIVKGNKELITSWSSDIIDKLYEERNNDVNLDLSGLDDFQLHT